MLLYYGIIYYILCLLYVHASQCTRSAFTDKKALYCNSKFVCNEFSSNTQVYQTGLLVRNDVLRNDHVSLPRSGQHLLLVVPRGKFTQIWVVLRYQRGMFACSRSSDVREPVVAQNATVVRDPLVSDQLVLAFQVATYGLPDFSFYCQQSN